ncbi:hypothetical protein BS17DRAFT_551851 [Gyrodon lividus]|nr:hypothetical protein BS17DRAFT_551851 [Gyrodon lividus]
MAFDSSEAYQRQSIVTSQDRSIAIHIGTLEASPTRSCLRSAISFRRLFAAGLIHGILNLLAIMFIGYFLPPTIMMNCSLKEVTFDTESKGKSQRTLKISPTNVRNRAQC